MIVIVDERLGLGSALVSGLAREGVAACHIEEGDLVAWLQRHRAMGAPDILAFVLGMGCDAQLVLRTIAARTLAAVIVVNESGTVEETLKSFALGADDVVMHPLHPGEIAARARAIRHRRAPMGEWYGAGEIQLFIDGRDPLVGGASLALPRRERHILECLAAAGQAWVSKSRILAEVYGPCSEGRGGNVVETHICRLRKRLRQMLGRDPIETQRFLGYRLQYSRQPLGKSQGDGAAPLGRRDVDRFGSGKELGGVATGA